ncbi:alpha-glucosidase [Apiospora rasikravindrae]|uniref:Probable alpha/beta-glucosidase agdC n=1 Tax=Apiospora rasikravindrae TaxID=990691 RepID=A0ABR1T5U5_9PEZI
MSSFTRWVAFWCTVLAVYGNPNKCSGYSASKIVKNPSSFQAELHLNSPGCAIFGPDLPRLQLRVEYQTESRLRVLIQETKDNDYVLPDEVLLEPRSDPSVSRENSLLSFEYTERPFSFQVRRKDTSDVLFDTSGSPLVFEPQYIRLRSRLPFEPNIYGLGEHIDNFRLPFGDNYTRTMWNRDSDGVPYRENLYSSHPVYFEQRRSGTHGVFLRNYNGADIKLNKDDPNQGHDYSIEYILTGGDLDFFFLAGPGPVDVSRQYAMVVGTPAMVPYWSLGFHQCKFGYQDWFEVAEVISNYSASGIPLETMWTDIDYMDHRRVFSLDKERFPVERMRDIVRHLHDHQQRYMLMVDPAIADWPYHAFDRGIEMDVFLKTPNAEYFRGVVWPGVTVFPDWLHPNASIYWDEQIEDAFNPQTGIDIDGIWIDMNEPASMCRYPCRHPTDEAKRLGVPLTRHRYANHLERFQTLIFRDPSIPRTRSRMRGPRRRLQLSERTMSLNTSSALGIGTITRRETFWTPLSHPQWRAISDLTVPTNIVHANGMHEYDIHNLYGLMMGMITHQAMLKRRPGLKPFIITRSTFAGAGRYVQKWLGDNASRWDHYRSSIAGLLGFASIFQIPMVGSDVCGFKLSPSDKLCARWTTLGAFSPFFRNHAHDEAPPQEFYLNSLVASAARHAMGLRYRLLDYLYTALQRQSRDGTPAINPLWYLYPADSNTYGIDLQYFFGSCILVSPVTDENATDVSAYFPNDVFYQLETGQAVRGQGAPIQLRNVPYDRIPLHVRGGCVVPMRVDSANTTTELRKKRFELLVAPGVPRGDRGGVAAAEGELYLDDGVSLDGGTNRLGLHFHYYEDNDDGSGNGIVEITEATEKFVEAQRRHNRQDGKSLQDLMEEAGFLLDRVVVLEAGHKNSSSPRVVFR